MRHTLPILLDLPNLNSLTSKPSLLAGKEALKEYTAAEAELSQLQEAEAAAAAEALAQAEAEAGDAEVPAEGESHLTPRPVVAKLLALREELDTCTAKAVWSKTKLDAISDAREKVRSSLSSHPPSRLTPSTLHVSTLPISHLIAVLPVAGSTLRRRNT